MWWVVLRWWVVLGHVVVCFEVVGRFAGVRPWRGRAARAEGVLWVCSAIFSAIFGASPIISGLFARCAAARVSDGPRCAALDEAWHSRSVWQLSARLGPENVCSVSRVLKYEANRRPTLLYAIALVLRSIDAAKTRPDFVNPFLIF